MKLDIPSHTDRRGTFKYDTDLSNTRAKSIIKWLIKNGINQNRLIGKGYAKA
jgi:outer membrane protein OmpA-like peptidoglycan-associated protein